MILVCFVGGLADTDQVYRLPVYVPSCRGTTKWCVLQFADSYYIGGCTFCVYTVEAIFAPLLPSPPLCRVFGWLQHTSWNSRATIP